MAGNKAGDASPPLLHSTGRAGIWLIALVLLLGCKGRVTNEAPRQPVQKITVAPHAAASFPAIFETAFFPGTTLRQDTLTLRFTTHFIGNIHLETGKVIACDPVIMHDAVPFTSQFPVGHFPVELAVAHFTGDARVAFARILFSAEPAQRWEVALVAGQSPIPVEAEEMYGYSVDAGVGQFIDQKANQFYDEWMKGDDSLWSRIYIDEPDKNYQDTWSWALFEYQGHSLANFSTGLGDGVYQTYIGYDKDGKICRLLTDFYLVDWNRK